MPPFLIVLGRNAKKWTFSKHDPGSGFFLEEDLFYTEKKTRNLLKKYIDTFKNLYTHTINIEHIIYMQESSGLPHIDQYSSKLYSLYTSNDRL